MPSRQAAKSNPEFIEAKTSGEYTAEELEGKEYIMKDGDVTYFRFNV